MSKYEHMDDKRDRRALKQTIEENLRKVYHDLLQAEVPDRFTALIDQLRQQSQSPAPAPADAAPSVATPPDQDPEAGL